MGIRRSRRAFGKSLALLAAAPLAAESAAVQPGDSQAVEGQAQALYEIVRTRFGTYLTEEQLKRVRQRLEAGVRSADLLRKLPLQNADEPDFTFTADVPE